MALPNPTIGYHSLMFIDDISNIGNVSTSNTTYRHTFDSWHMVPTKRPSIEPPDVKTFYGSIPGADGEQDLTEALSGRPLFGMRKGSIEFLILNGYRPWNDLYTELLMYFHGQKRDMILEDDLAFFYRGRFTLSNYDSQENYSRITLNYVLEPYKRDINTYVSSWLWDPFDFTTGERLIKTVTDEFTLQTGTSFSSQTINLPMSSAAYLCHVTVYERGPAAGQTQSITRLHYTKKDGTSASLNLYGPTGTSFTQIDKDIVLDVNSFTIRCTSGKVYVRLRYNLGIL